MGTLAEMLIVGNCYLKKAEQNDKLKLDYKKSFELD
jgi:carbamoyltransferase